jgi:hypothetical protein
MEYNSSEIEKILISRQINLYKRIDDLLNQRFNELDPGIVSDLTSTLIELDDRIFNYTKGMKNSELFGVSYHENRKQRKLESISLIEIFIIQ